jgi:hypothetical protein
MLRKKIENMCKSSINNSLEFCLLVCVKLCSSEKMLLNFSKIAKK